jgi:hypothetical protein
MEKTLSHIPDDKEPLNTIKHLKELVRAKWPQGKPPPPPGRPSLQQAAAVQLATANVVPQPGSLVEAAANRVPQPGSLAAAAAQLRRTSTNTDTPREQPRSLLTNIQGAHSRLRRVGDPEEQRRKRDEEIRNTPTQTSSGNGNLPNLNTGLLDETARNKARQLEDDIDKLLSGKPIDKKRLTEMIRFVKKQLKDIPIDQRTPKQRHILNSIANRSESNDDDDDVNSAEWDG